MVSLRVLDSEVLRMAFQFEYFFLIQKGKMMSPHVQAFKVHGFTSDFKFGIGINEYYL